MQTADVSSKRTGGNQAPAHHPATAVPASALYRRVGQTISDRFTPVYTSSIAAVSRSAGRRPGPSRTSDPLQVRRFRSQLALAVVGMTICIELAQGWSMHLVTAHGGGGSPLVAGLAMVGPGLIALVAGVALTWRVTERLRVSIAELAWGVTHDALTGLPNRHRLEVELGHRAASSPDATGWMLLIGVERVRMVNEALGHAWGDRLLLVTAERLSAVLGDHVCLARVGGTEFAVWLEGVDAETAMATAHTIDAALQASVNLEDLQVEPGARIGLCAYPEQADSVPVLLSRAGVAAMVARREQRPPTVYDHRHDAESVDQLALRADLRTAMANRSVVFHYQPKLDLATGRWRSVEALARWNDAERGWVPPPVFIRAAELGGIIHELTLYLLGVACRDAATLREQGVDCPIAVNISAISLADPNLPQHIASCLREAGIPPSAIELELTESAAIMDHEGAARVLSRVRASGVRVAIDDFGTGMSSLSYLRELPIDTIKIDRSFVRRLSDEGSPRDRRIVANVVRLAHDLDLDVVAEGVEDGATLELLEQLGCDMAQGYVIARPMPFDQLELELAQHGVVSTEFERGVWAHTPVPQLLPRRAWALS